MSLEKKYMGNLLALTWSVKENQFHALEQKSNLNNQNREPQPLDQFTDLRASLQIQIPLNWVESTWGSTLEHHQECILALPGWLCLGEKQIGLLVMTRYCLWTDTNSRRHKISLWSTDQSKNIWKSGHQWSFSSDPSHSKPSESQTSSWVYFPSLRMHNR